jgi:hypothetical protein
MTSQRLLACTSGVIFSVAVLFSGIASAQAPPEPKPGPEHENLKFFVGKWTTTGDEKPSPMGAGGKFTMTDSCELFPGGFFVVCRSSGKRAGGPAHGLGILGYDDQQKAYTYTGIDSTMGGHMDAGEGKKEGDVWTYTNTMDMGGGKKMQGRYIMNNFTPNSYSFKYEMAPEGSSEWQTMMEGKSTRAGGAKAKPDETMKKEGETIPKKSSPDKKTQ